MNLNVQPQQMARGLKFLIGKVELLFYVVKRKGLISCTITAKLICAFAFKHMYAKSRFSQEAAHLVMIVMMHLISPYGELTKKNNKWKTQLIFSTNWALLWENRSSGFPTRSETNRAVQSLNMARGLKFRFQKEEVLYYPCSEKKGADQLRGYREADLRLSFRIYKNLIFSWRGSI